MNVVGGRLALRDFKCSALHGNSSVRSCWAVRILQITNRWPRRVCRTACADSRSALLVHLNRSFGLFQKPLSTSLHTQNRHLIIHEDLLFIETVSCCSGWFSSLSTALKVTVRNCYLWKANSCCWLWVQSDERRTTDKYLLENNWK